MDTTPFHLILFALDIVLLGCILLWLRFRRSTSSSAVYQFEKSLYVDTAAPVRLPSLRWDLSGIILFGGLGLLFFAALSRTIRTGFVQQNIYHFNAGQCVVEGIAVHGTLFLAGVAVILCYYRRHWLAIPFACFALFLAGLGFNVIYWEPYRLKVEYYEIKTSKVKSPIRIVFVSDIQTDRIGSHEINTLKKIQQQNADLIILGGDYIQTYYKEQDEELPEKFRQMLLDYPLEAPLGVFAIEGNIGFNHQLFEGTNIEFVRRSEIHDYLGENKGKGPIDLVLLSLMDSRGDVGDRGLTDSGNFIVMAGHFPTYAVDGHKSPRSGVVRSGYRDAVRAPDLMLAGHTHGGQIIIPFYGPVPPGTSIPFFGHLTSENEYAEQVPREMWSGFFTYPNGGRLLITRGSGMERGWAPRIRLFCPSEISVIDIVPE